MLGAFGQIPINDYMIGKMAQGDIRARVYGVRYVVSFTVLAAALPLIAFIYERWGFDALFRVLAVAALLILAAVTQLPQRLPTPAPAPADSSGSDASDERRDRVGRGLEIAAAGEARTAARPEIVIAVAGPMERDRRRQRHRLDLAAIAERIALALHDQRRTTHGDEMRGAQLLGFGRWMERVAEADEARIAPAANWSSAIRLATRPPIDLPPMNKRDCPAGIRPRTTAIAISYS